MFLYLMMTKDKNYFKVGIGNCVMTRQWHISKKCHIKNPPKILICFPVRKRVSETQLLNLVKPFLIGNTEWFSTKYYEEVLPIFLSFYDEKVRWPKNWYSPIHSKQTFESAFYYENTIQMMEYLKIKKEGKL